MGQSFAFIGDPGPDAPRILRTLHDAGFVPKRFEQREHLVEELADAAPAAVVFDESVLERKRVVAGLREDSRLSSIPFVARVRGPESFVLESVFNDGMDDYFVDGSVEQFSAFVSVLSDKEAIPAVRAPAGQILLAHPERLERVRIATVLRRNGFDTFFAATADELGRALKSSQPRAVIASTLLAEGDAIVDLARTHSGGDGAVSPWIVCAPLDDAEHISSRLPERPECKVFEEGSDVAGLTFLLNEMLSPPPVGVRRTPRLLYGAPAKFINEGGDVPFFGYTFNANLGGIYVRSLTPFPLQTRLELSFQPPFGRGRVVATAQVSWVKNWGDTGGAASPPGMGIQFLEMWTADSAGYEAGYGELLEFSQSASSAPSKMPGGI